MKTQDKEIIRLIGKMLLYVLLGLVVIFGGIYLIEKARERSKGGESLYFTVDSLEIFGPRGNRRERRENLTIFCTPTVPQDAPEASERKEPFILKIVESTPLIFGQRGSLWNLRHDLFEEGTQYFAQQDAGKEAVKAVYLIHPADLQKQEKDSAGLDLLTVKADKVYAHSKPETDFEALDRMRERQTVRNKDMVKDLENTIKSRIDSLRKKGFDPKTVDSLIRSTQRRLDFLNRRLDPRRFDSTFRNQAPPPRRDIDLLPGQRNPGQRRGPQGGNQR